MRLSFGPFVLCLLGSCSSPSRSPDDPPPPVSPLPPLRPGTVELSPKLGGDVVGAAAVGDRFGVLAGTTSHLGVFVSEDRGATWSRREAGSVELSYGLVLSGADAYVFAGRREGSSTLPGTRVVKVGAAGTATEVGVMKAKATWFGPTGAAGFEMQLTSTRSWVYSRIDAFGAIHDESVPLAAGEEDCVPAFQSADGELFTGVCYSLSERCRLSVRPATSLAITRDCMGYREWPVPFRATQRDAVADGQVLRVWEDQSHVFARSLSAADSGQALGPVIDLGVGTQDFAMNDGQWERWGSLFRLVTDGTPQPRRLVELRQGQPYEVVLPPSPCQDDLACPDLLTQNPRNDGRLVRVVPLGEGHYLTVYRVVPLEERVSPPPSGESIHLLARIAKDGEGTATLLDESKVFAGPGNAIADVPAPSELENLCARALACSPGITTMNACLKYWLRVRSGQAEHDLSFQRFLATPAGCSGFATSFPALTAARGGSCGPQCVAGHALLTCAPTGLHEVLDCEAIGGSCVVQGGQAGCAASSAFPCDQCDANGRAVQCRAGKILAIVDCPQRGESCYAPGGDQPTAFCGPGTCAADAQQFDCSGKLLASCSQAANKAIFATDDCSRLGLACGTRWNRSPECYWEKTCHLPDGPACSGRYLRYCAMAEQRFVDCVALGFATCQPRQLDAEAHCGP